VLYTANSPLPAPSTASTRYVRARPPAPHSHFLDSLPLSHSAFLRLCSLSLLLAGPCKAFFWARALFGQECAVTASCSAYVALRRFRFELALESDVILSGICAVVPAADSRRSVPR
jgi:hypothetical protein